MPQYVCDKILKQIGVDTSQILPTTDLPILPRITPYTYNDSWLHSTASIQENFTVLSL